MKTFILACEVLRPELEMLAADMADPPHMQFLEQRLHDYPDMLRGKFQETVEEFENQCPGPLTVLCGYGLCGRGLCGVRAKRATLVFPRLHDCIPLLRGLEPTEARKPLHACGTYWITPGWLQSFLIPFHLEEHKRFAQYEAKVGPAKAARMVAAENALLNDYTQTCHIRWPEMGDAFVPVAQDLAAKVELPYSEIPGASWYLKELLEGGKNRDHFLHLAPGQSIDMEVDGTICIVPAPES